MSSHKTDTVDFYKDCACFQIAPTVKTLVSQSRDPVKQLGQPSSSQGTELIPPDIHCNFCAAQMLPLPVSHPPVRTKWENTARQLLTHQYSLTQYLLNQTCFLLSQSLAFYFISFLERRKERISEVKTKENTLPTFQKWSQLFSKHFWWNTNIAGVVFLWE